MKQSHALNPQSEIASLKLLHTLQLASSVTDVCQQTELDVTYSDTRTLAAEVKLMFRLTSSFARKVILNHCQICSLAHGKKSITTEGGESCRRLQLLTVTSTHAMTSNQSRNNLTHFG